MLTGTNYNVCVMLLQQNASTPVLGYMSPRISSPAHPSSAGATPQSGGGAGRGRGRGDRRDKELIGQTVRVTQGPYKGQFILY